MSIYDLTNDELARAADLYFERVLISARAAGAESNVSIRITAQQSSSTAEFTVEHALDVGYYPNEAKHRSANLFRSVDILLPRVQSDAALAPVERSLALPAPVKDEEEYADFAPVAVNTQDDEQF